MISARISNYIIRKHCLYVGNAAFDRRISLSILFLIDGKRDKMNDLTYGDKTPYEDQAPNLISDNSLILRKSWINRH